MPRKIPDTITCISADNLQREFGPIAVALNLEETEETWDNILFGLKSLTAVAKGSAANFPADIVLLIKPLTRPINRALLSERSRLTGAATDLVVMLATSMKNHFEPLISAFVPTLLTLATRPSKLLVSRAKACLVTIAEETLLPSLVAHFRIAVTDKSASLRLVATDVVLVCLNCFNPPDLEKPQRADDIEAVIRATIRDANADVRSSSRRVFEAYKLLLPSRVDAFIGPLSPITRKYLNLKGVTNVDYSKSNTQSNAALKGQSMMTKSTSATLTNTGTAQEPLSHRAQLHRKAVSASHIESEKGGILPSKVDGNSFSDKATKELSHPTVTKTTAGAFPDPNIHARPRERINPDDRRRPTRPAAQPVPSTSTLPSSHPPSRPPTRPTSALSDCSSIDHNVQVTTATAEAEHHHQAKRYPFSQKGSATHAASRDITFRPLRPQDSDANDERRNSVLPLIAKGGARRVPRPPSPPAEVQVTLAIKGDRTDVHPAEKTASKAQPSNAKPRTATKTVDNVSSHLKETAATNSSGSTQVDKSSQLRPKFKPSHGRSNSATEEKPHASESRREGTAASRLGAPTLSQLAKVRTVIKPPRPVIKSTNGVASSKTNHPKTTQGVTEVKPAPHTVDKDIVQPEAIPLPASPVQVKVAPSSVGVVSESGPSSTVEVEAGDAKVVEQAHDHQPQHQVAQDVQEETVENISGHETTVFEEVGVVEVASPQYLPFSPLRLKGAMEEPVAGPSRQANSNSAIATPIRAGRQESFLTADTATPISMLVRSIQQGFVLSPIADIESPDTTIPYPEWQEEAETTLDELQGIEFDRDGVRADGTVIVSPRKRRLQTDVRKDLLSGRDRGILADINF